LEDDLYDFRDYLKNASHDVRESLDLKKEVSPSQNLETLNNYEYQFNTQEYKKETIYGNRILIKAIYKKITARVGETLMIVEVDGFERKIVHDVSGDYVLVQGQENVWYQGPIVVAVIKKEKPVIIPKTSTPTVTNKTYNTVTPPKVQNSSVGESSLPTYHYWLLISSYLLSFTYIAPIIGIIASFVAYSDIETSSNKDKEGKLGLTIGAGVLHGFFIILGIYSNGGF
jgi:hypothetical protein